MGQGNHVIGIIIVAMKLMGSEVDNLVSGSLELGDQLLFEFESTMIGCKSYAHTLEISFPLPQGKGEALPSDRTKTRSGDGIHTADVFGSPPDEGVTHGEETHQNADETIPDYGKFGCGMGVLGDKHHEG